MAVQKKKRIRHLYQDKLLSKSYQGNNQILTQRHFKVEYVVSDFKNIRERTIYSYWKLALLEQICN